MQFLRFLLVSSLALALLAPLARSQDGQLPIRVKVTKSREDNSTIKSTLDPNTHTCVEEKTNSSDKLIQKTVYQLDLQNRPLTGVVTNARDEFLYNVTFRNDPMSGLVLEETDTNKDGQVLRRILFHYSSSGQLTGSDVTDANGNAVQSGPAIKDRDRKKLNQR